MNLLPGKIGIRIAAMLPGFALLSLFIPGLAVAQTGDHHRDYLAALEVTLAAQERLAGEMDRISDGSVAHYDFLQNEHIELLRHARALRFPPARVTAQSRDTILARADALVVAADSLELVIADFLRSQAQLHSAISNTKDLVAVLSKSGAANLDAARLQQLEGSTTRLQGDNSPERLATLEAAFDAVLAMAIDADRKAELLVQKQQILANVPLSAAARNQLAKADVTGLAQALKSEYLAAMQDA